jgi:hypothetical protein
VSWSPGASGLISRVGAEIESGGAQRAKESVGRAKGLGFRLIPWALRVI